MKNLLFFLTLLIVSSGIKAQQTDSLKKSNTADSLMNMLNTEDKQEKVVAIFKSTRLILAPTTETVKKKNFNFLVIHRFGDIAGKEGGSSTFFGLDNSSDILIGFEYGLSNNLDISFGRNKFSQLIDGGLKYAIVHQTADNSSPIALTLVGKAGLRPYKDANGIFKPYTNRFSYSAQAIIARKLSSAFSLQVSPTFIRNNSPYPFVNGNDKQFFALGAAARLRVTKHMSFIVDYAHPFSSFRQNSVDPKFYDPLGVGIEIQTGGHVFTINFSNAKAISEISYLSYTQSKWSSGQFRLGFTISRMFDFNAKHKKSYK